MEHNQSYCPGASEKTLASESQDTQRQKEHNDHFEDRVLIYMSSSVSELSNSMKNMLNQLIQKNYMIILSGYYDGHFKIQHFLNLQGYRNVTIYAEPGQTVFNIGKWPVETAWVKYNDFGIYSPMSRDCKYCLFFIQQSADINLEWIPWISQQMQFQNKKYYYVKSK